MNVRFTWFRAVFALVCLFAYVLVIASGMLVNCTCVEDNCRHTQHGTRVSAHDCCSDHSDESTKRISTEMITVADTYVDCTNGACSSSGTSTEQHERADRNDTPKGQYSDIHPAREGMSTLSSIASRHAHSIPFPGAGKPSTPLETVVLLI